MAASLIQRLRELFTPPRPVAKGLYQYRTAPDAPQRYRLHLRVEADGTGVLIVNAATVLHLNESAVAHAKMLIDEVPLEEAGRRLAKMYRVPPETAEADGRRLRDLIQQVATQEDACPVALLDVGRVEPLQTSPTAPYRVDLALTYRCDNDCGHCYVDRPRSTPEMTTAEWRQAMDILWTAGVPHLCFTGGEATLRDDLADLILYAEDVGFVTGLLTNGRRLSDRSYLDGLVTAGLDHVQITLESHDEAIHDGMVGAGAWRETVQGVRNAVAADLYAIANTTITRANVDGIEQTVDFIADLGIRTFACNGLIHSGQGKGNAQAIPEGELGAVLERVTLAAERNGMRFIWYTPTQYCELNPLELSLGIKTCTAARYNLCVEPDGQVIPCQSYYSPLGHVLRDPWPNIWNHPLAERLREKGDLPEKCHHCDSRELCGGGCPLYPGAPSSASDDAPGNA